MSGVDNVAILDGGFAAWRAAPGYPLAMTTTEIVPTIFPVKIDKTLLAESTDFESIARSGGATLIDARPAGHYSGHDKVAAVKALGHIPGAVNLDSAVFYDASRNRLKPKTELARIASALPKGPIVISGHWSATVWFVFSELLHRSQVRLYYGSMIEWTADPRHPVETTP